MRRGCGRVFAGIAVAAALFAPAYAQGRPGQGPAGGGRGMGAPGGTPPGFGGPLIRISPDALRSGPAAPRASQATSVHDVLFGDRSGSTRGPASGRYALDAGGGFVFDREGDLALVRFDDSPEVWALTPTAGPRGDLIFKNDVGQPVLRSTRMGGMTLFTPSRPEGEPVSPSGVAVSLRPPTSIGPQALLQAMFQASNRASRVAQHQVAFEAPDVTPATDWAFADAAWVAAEAFVRAAQGALAGGPQGGRGLAARFFSVRFSAGRAPQVVGQAPVLQIVVAPDRGPAGRPSSQRILMVLTRR